MSILDVLEGLFADIQAIEEELLEIALEESPQQDRGDRELSLHR
jgi:hypothetical protein